MWIARDKDSKALLIGCQKPFRDKLCEQWEFPRNTFYTCVYGFGFNSLKWEDEPIEVCLVPTEYVNNFIDDIEQDIEQEKEYVRNLRDNF